MSILLELNVVNEPHGIDLQPTRSMIQALNDMYPDLLQPGAVNLKLIDDAAIRDLNKKYSGQDKATDVLSFSYIDPARSELPGPISPEGELGDVTVSLETAARQATEAETSLADEIATLTLHGILHVLGLDHAKADERSRMDRLQADILAQAGVKYRNFQWV